MKKGEQPGEETSPGKTGGPGSRPQPGPAEIMRSCPNCSAELQQAHCKLTCPHCGFFLSCSDFY